MQWVRRVWKFGLVSRCALVSGSELVGGHGKSAGRARRRHRRIAGSRSEGLLRSA